MASRMMGRAAVEAARETLPDDADRADGLLALSAFYAGGAAAKMIIAEVARERDVPREIERLRVQARGRCPHGDLARRVNLGMALALFGPAEAARVTAMFHRGASHVLARLGRSGLAADRRQAVSDEVALEIDVGLHWLAVRRDELTATIGGASSGSVH